MEERVGQTALIDDDDVEILVLRVDSTRQTGGASSDYQDVMQGVAHSSSVWMRVRKPTMRRGYS